VFACPRGRDAHGHMPVVGTRDHHRIDVISRQKVPEIAIGGAACIRLAGSLCVVGLDPGLLGLDTPGVHITNRHDLGMGRIQKLRHVDVVALAACADDAYGNPVARGFGPKHARRCDKWHGGACHSLQKPAT